MASGRSKFFCRSATAISFGFILLAQCLAQDSAPQLISRTGGGGETWSSLAALEAAASKGNPHACAQLGEELWRGGDNPKDGPRALSLLEQAARAGEASAAFRLGMLLDDGDGVAQDHVRAVSYFRAAAAGGAMEAMHNVGTAYVTGRGLKRQYAEAMAWLILARQHGDESGVEGQLRERLEKWKRSESIEAGEKRAVELERELAQAEATSFLPEPAPLAYTGVMSERHTASADLAVEETQSLNRPAFVMPKLVVPGTADDGSPPIRVVLPTGRVVRWSNLTALRRAADRGDAAALAALGQALLEGKLAPRDPDTALTTLERGAKAGSADAAHLLAEIYTKGDVVIREPEKAFAYSLQAARGGALVSIFNVGALYANGSGTERDFTAALAWLIVAKHYRVDPSQEKRIRDYLAKAHPEQIPVAEQRAEELVREIDAALQRARSAAS